LSARLLLPPFIPSFFRKQVEEKMEFGVIPPVIPSKTRKKGGRKSGMHFRGSNKKDAPQE
jgi:hypothetical protein